jgi:ATP-dependent helicase/nuclease subunit A
MSELADIDARRRILTEFGATFFVEAAAGTGKTTALVGRIVGLVKNRGWKARADCRGDFH